MSYKIIRFYSSGKKCRVIATGLTLEEARAHCSRDDTHKLSKDGKSIIWFDGFSLE